jgi:hypothetical protein
VSARGTRGAQGARGAGPSGPETAEALHAALLALPSVTVRRHRFGGREYWAGDVEIGHSHGAEKVDVHAGAALAAAVVRRGLAESNVYAPPGWVSVPLDSPTSYRVALWLLTRNHRRALTGRPVQSSRPGQPGEP